MIDPATDNLVPLADVIRQRLGRRVGPATIWRWRLKGINGAKLPAIRCGQRWMTTVAAFADFIRAQTANCQPAPLDSDAPTERSAATTAKLKAAGLV